MGLQFFFAAVPEDKAWVGSVHLQSEDLVRGHGLCKATELSEPRSLCPWRLWCAAGGEEPRPWMLSPEVMLLAAPVESVCTAASLQLQLSPRHSS